MHRDNICFFDSETRAREGTPPLLGDVTKCGTYAYADHAFITIITYCIGDAPVTTIAMDEGFEPNGFQWRDMPDDLREHFARAEKGEAWFAAFNAGFDRTVWFRSTYDFPFMPPEYCVDIMAQAVASGLPPSLEGASRFLGRGGKQTGGKKLIKQFASSDGDTPQTAPDDWHLFKTYAEQDTDEAREVWKSTLQLRMTDWEEYWASETVNDRGMLIDEKFVERADAVAQANLARSNHRLPEMTGGVVTKVTQVQRLVKWVYDLVEHAEAREIMVKEYDDTDPDDVKVVKIGLSRPQIEKLLAFYARLNEEQGLTDEEANLVEVLEIRQWDGSAAPQKFKKMLLQQSDNLLLGSYVFNGAAQTGRYSSKGVQMHNMTNKPLGLEQGDFTLEDQAIEMINDLEPTT